MGKISLALLFVVCFGFSAAGALETDSPYPPPNIVRGSDITLGYSIGDPPDGYSLYTFSHMEFYICDDGTWNEVMPNSWSLFEAVIPGVQWDYITENEFGIGMKAIFQSGNNSIAASWFSGPEAYTAISDVPEITSITNSGNWTVGETITVSWDITPSTLITGYYVFGTISGLWLAEFDSIDDIDARSCSFTLGQNAIDIDQVVVRAFWRVPGIDGDETDSVPWNVIVSPPTPEVTVTYPNTAVAWTVGDQVQITWDSCNNCGITGYTVEIKKGTEDWYVIGENIPAGTRSLNWAVVGTAPICKIRVTAAVSGEPSVSDESDVAFSIENPQPALVDVTSIAIPGIPLQDEGAVAIGDYDNDGWDDLYYVRAQESGSSILYHNNGNGTFTEESRVGAIQAGSDHGSPYMVDLGNNGTMNLFVTAQPDVLARWNGSTCLGAGTIPESSMWSSYGSVWVDVEPDGDLDLFETYIQNVNTLYYRTSFPTNYPYFSVDSEVMAGLETDWSRKPSFVDFDLDGDPDFYIPSRDNGDRFFENIGQGKFEDMQSALFGMSIGSKTASWGDFDNDGYMDAALIIDHVVRLFRNNSGMSFTEVPAIDHQIILGGSAMDICWLDFDNDGFLDIAVAGFSATYARLFSGFGDGSFNEMANLGLLEGHSVVASDYDQDGDLDLFSQTQGRSILRNDNYAFGNHWLQLDLTGQVSNRSAIGARVVLTSGGNKQTRVVGNGDGYLSQSSNIVSFGLGLSTQLTSLVIHWPNGIEQDITSQVSADARFEITEPNHVLTAQINAAGTLMPVAGNVLVGSPAGNEMELVVTIDFDDTLVSGTISAADLDIIVDANAGYSFCGPTYNDTDGTSSNGYTVTLRRKYIGGCSGCIGDGCHEDKVETPLVKVELNGQQVGVIPGLIVHSPDLDGNGAVNLDDVSTYTTIFYSSETSSCLDFDVDGLVDLNDTSLLVSHYGDACPSTKSANSYDPAMAGLVRIEESSISSLQRRVSFDVPNGVEALGLVFELGEKSSIDQWSKLESAANVHFIPFESDGMNKLMLVVNDLEKLVGQQIDLVNLTLNPGHSPSSFNSLVGASGSVLTTNGDVIEFEGSAYDDQVVLPGVSAVHRVYPNPFNPQVTIEYSVAKQSHVSIKVFDVSGRLVRTLVNEQQSASTGMQSVVWNGHSDKGVQAPSGVYFWKLTTIDSETTGRMALVK